MIRALRTRLVAAAMLSPAGGAHGDSGGHSPGQLPGIVSDAPYILNLLAEGDSSLPLPTDFNWEEEGPAAAPPELGV